MRHPSSTYRLQIRAAFDLDAAANVTDYLHDLGIDWAYLSPLLRATAGSDHGYDVVDPSMVDPARGGRAGFERFVSAARAGGLGVLVDIVPNHMGVAVPAENPWWWDLLLRGRESRYADAFDIDWAFGAGRIRLPILGDDLEAVLTAGEITIDPTETDAAPFGVLRYYDHVLPLAEGSSALADVPAVLDAQHYELLFWQREATELNYRRFFAVTTLAAVRVELPEVFAQAHAEVIGWVNDGLIDGLRVDHPDGLADPGAYLVALSEATGGLPVWVEKILEHSATDHPEALPSWWHTVGTTGYDALAEIERMLIDPAGANGLDELDADLRRDTDLPGPQSWSDLIHSTKRMIADSIQVAEIRRLVRTLPTEVAAVAGAEDALAEVLACYPVYRSYLPAGEEFMTQAIAEASERRPDLADAIAALVPALTDTSAEVARRFQQTTGPVMAKGVEDTAFYRYTRLGSLTEVGGDPSVFSLDVGGFHRAFAARQASWPLSLTTLSTHDTKRGEDVRARLDVLAEMPERWAGMLGELRGVASSGHGPFDALLWQAIIGSWPATPERLHAYAEKAAREAAEATGWWQPNAEFEQRMHAVVDAAYGPAHDVVDGFVAEIAAAGWSNSLGAKLLQLTGPGVPDVYQGSELWETSLVDPDNRRAVDFDLRRRLLVDIDAGARPEIDASGAAKLLVTSRALRLRRDHPELFTKYTPLEVVGEASAHAVAFDRGGALTVATRLPLGLVARGGWADTAVMLPEGAWVDVLTGTQCAGGILPLGTLLHTYPVALLAPAPTDVSLVQAAASRKLNK
ncbi:malto-oligosyltrehalose synthase [Microbacterium halimionae]|uniref:malto-oligosyltrehalose synthase n=2 Tax=Microbacterium halimionae TaxID=1526413 RepID=UPI00141F2628|nr:malto-oligosyltrehalose synthase [Microbacterium halimionae]